MQKMLHYGEVWLHDCPVILGSATPAITSYYKALQGQYKLLELPTRIFDQANASCPYCGYERGNDPRQLFRIF